MSVERSVTLEVDRKSSVFDLDLTIGTTNDQFSLNISTTGTDFWGERFYRLGAGRAENLKKQI